MMTRLPAPKTPFITLAIAILLLAAPPARAGTCEALGGGPLDGDLDGFEAPLDCDDADANNWLIPGEVPELLFDDPVLLGWMPAADPGGALPTYTVLRSEDPADFGGPGVICLDPLGLDLQATDTDSPLSGQLFSYLVRAVNGCGEGPLGFGRVGISCDCAVLCDDLDDCTADDCFDGSCRNDVIPPLVLRQPRSAANCDGDESRFTVLASGHGALSYQWYKNGVPVGMDSPELVLPSITPADDGATIHCEITDGCATTASAPVTLTVFGSTLSCQGGNDGPEAPNGASDGEPPWTGDGLRRRIQSEPSMRRFRNTGAVYLHSGEFYLQETDLVVQSRGFDLVWARKYRSRVQVESAMGIGWDHSYNIYIEASGPDLVLHDGTSRSDTYSPSIVPGCWTAPGFFRELCLQADSTYALTFPDKRIWRLHALDGTPEEGRVFELTDRNGNTMLFAYDAAGRLTTIFDTLGRQYDIAYGPFDYIESFTDFTGRQVRYEHYLAGEPGGSFGDLKSVTSPEVVGTSTGNDFPSGKTTTYIYDEDRPDAALNHNLIAIIDPAGQILLENGYTTSIFPSHPRFDRLDRQSFIDGTIGYVYVPQTPTAANGFAVTKTIVNDAVGNVSERYFDADNRLVMVRDYTGRAPDPELPSDDSFNRPGAPLRPGDPPYFETLYEYNADHLLAHIAHPEGNEFSYLYDSSNPDVRLRANRTYAEFVPGPRGGSPSPITLSWSYCTDFGTVPPTDPVINNLDNGYHPDDMLVVLGFRVEIDGAGTGQDADSAWETCTGGALNIEVADSSIGSDRTHATAPGHKYIDELILTREEHERSYRQSLSPVGLPPRDDYDQRTYMAQIASVPWCGHCNAGGDCYTRILDANGNITSLERPLVATGVLGGGTQLIVDSWDHNAFGQTIEHVNPEGRIDHFSYHTSGCELGYLEKTTVDVGGFALEESYEYDCLGRLVRIVDPRGNDTLYEYNALDQIVRQSSREFELGSGVRYDRSLYRDADDNVTRLEIQNLDGDGNPEPNGYLSRAYERDRLDHIVRVTREVDDGYCAVTEHGWDGNDNLTLTRFGEATSGAQPNNNLRVAFDERDLVYRVTRAEDDPDISTTQYDYDGNGNVVTMISGLEDPSGPHLDSWTYDGYDRPVQHVDPEGNFTETSYDGNHNRLWLRRDGELVEGVSGVNVRLYEADYVYDEVDRLVSVTEDFFNPQSGTPLDDGSSESHLYYNALSQLIRLEDDNGHGLGVAYDSADRVEVLTDDKGNSATLSYDAGSDVTGLTEVDKSDLLSPDEIISTTYSYDPLNRLIGRVDNVGNSWQFSYDSRDNHVRRTDALGNVSTYTYDGLDRRIRTDYDITDTGDGTGTLIGVISTHRLWDDSSRLTGRSDDAGNTTTYSYDPLNRLIQLDHADGTSAQIDYDVHGNPLTVVDANGTVSSATYDDLDRLTARSIVHGPGVSGTTFENFLYDGMSRLVQAQDDDSLVAFGWDSLSHSMSQSITVGAGPAMIVTTVRDGEGNPLQTTYPSGRVVTKGFDELDRPLNISDGGGAIADYFYVGPYRRERLDHGNGTRSAWSYDPLRRVMQTDHTVIATSLSFDRRSYGWDPESNKTQHSDLLAGTSIVYDYDSIYRLVQSVRGAITIDYTLDGVGNRGSVSGGPDPGAYSMDATLPHPGDHQMNQYTTTSFDSREYDANGNVVSADDGVRQLALTYDYRNRLIEVDESPSGLVSTYSYDPLGRRIGKSVGGPSPDVWHYAYDGPHVVEEQDGVGGPLATYAYGWRMDERLVMDEAADLNGNFLLDEYTYHTDDLGSVMVVTDSTGGIVESYTYDDYGTPMPSSAIFNPYLFTGRRYDGETGWYEYRTRYFDPRAGRFITRDTIGIWGDRLNIGNAYSYVGNNPASLVDPLGRAGYIKFPGIEGEAQDKDHKQWIDLLSFQQGISQPGRAATGPTRRRGDAVIDDLPGKDKPKPKPKPSSNEKDPPSESPGSAPATPQPEEDEPSGLIDRLRQLWRWFWGK